MKVMLYNADDTFDVWCPYIREVIELTDTTLVYIGTMRDRLGIRYMSVDRGPHIRINVLKVEEIEDVSTYWYDEEIGYKVCMTPTYKIRITYSSASS